jgi:hypothetical protein
MPIDLKKISVSLQIVLVILWSRRPSLPTQSGDAEPGIDEPRV